MARRTPQEQPDKAKLANVAAQVAALGRMASRELAVKYEELFGAPPRTRNKEALRKRIAWRIQELAEGGLSPRALERIEQLAKLAPVRWRRPADPAASSPEPTAIRDPRLPAVATVVSRVHGGVEHRVTVLETGFEYQGTCYRSLSKIARVITGTPWNGFLFFFGRAHGTKGRTL